MSYLTFALKRLLRTAYPVLCILSALIVWAAPFAAQTALPNAGVCDLDNSVHSRAVEAYLMENGFVCLEDEAQLQSLVNDGELDCGLILSPGLGEAIQKGTAEGMLRFVESPASFVPKLYKYHAAAAVFRQLAPYISAQAFEGSAVEQADVLSAYEAYFQRGFAFSFELESMAAAEYGGQQRENNLLCGSAAILMFLLMLSGASELLDKDFAALRWRIGRKKSLALIVLPAMGLRLAAAAIAFSAAMFAAGRPELVPAIWLYGLLMAELALLLGAILPGRRSLGILLPLWLVASLALCPLFIDLAALFPVLKTLRLLLPPWWLWLIAQDISPWTAAAAAGIPICIAAFYLRGKRKIS